MSTELKKCNNIWSYIRYRIPPSVVALKFSHGLVINFFCKFSKLGSMISSYAFFLIFQNFWIFQLFSKCWKIWKIQKIVNDEITKPIFEKFKKVDEILTKPFFEKFKKKLMTNLPTNIHDIRIYATSRHTVT